MWEDILADFDTFAGDQSAAGITDIMGMPGATYGDYSGPSVFDNLGDTPTEMDLYSQPETIFGGAGYAQPDLSWADGGGGGGFSWSSLFSGQNLGTIARLAGTGLSMGAGLNALGQARQLGQQARAADPMEPYRAGWAARLNALLADPSQITSEPGYAAALEAVKRGGAAAGYFNSGNMVGDLAQFGVDFYDRAVNRLGRLVGGTPGGGLPATQSSINLTNEGLNRIGSGIASLATGLFDQK